MAKTMEQQGAFEQQQGASEQQQGAFEQQQGASEQQQQPQDIRAVVTELLSPVVAQMQQLPGMVKRMVAEAATSQSAPAKPEKSSGNNGANDETVKLRNEVAELNARMRDESVRSAIVNAMGEISLISGVNREDVQQLLQQRVRFGDDNKPYMVADIKLPATGQVTSQQVSIGDGVRNYFERNKGLIKATVTGGVGTQASAGDVKTAPTTYKELYDNPSEMAHWLSEDPDLVARLRAAHNAK